MLESPLDAQQRPRTICRFFTLLCELSNLNTQCDIKDAQGKKNIAGHLRLSVCDKSSSTEGCSAVGKWGCKGFKNDGQPTWGWISELRHPDR